MWPFKKTPKEHTHTGLKASTPNIMEIPSEAEVLRRANRQLTQKLLSARGENEKLKKEIETLKQKEAKNASRFEQDDAEDSQSPDD